MALLGNILWFIFFGWWNFLLYGFLGLLCFITVIGIPIGKALWQYAKLMTLPYGKVIIKETDLKGKENVSIIRRVGGMIANIIWLPIGIITFLMNIGAMILCAISIIGIPIAVVIARSCKFLLWPVGAKVITKEEAETLRMEKSMMRVMGTAMAVNQKVGGQMAQPQTVSYPRKAVEATETQPLGNQVAQPQEMEYLEESATAHLNQTLENVKAGGTQMLEGLKETGEKVMGVIAATSGAGAAALKNKQAERQEQVLAWQKDVMLDELLAQMEAKLYQNKVMAWIMPFLEYLTLGVGILFAIFGMVRWNSLLLGREIAKGMFGVLVGGSFYGIFLAAPFMLLAILLGVIKRNSVFVLIITGGQLLAQIVLKIMGAQSYILWILCYIGFLAGYLLFTLKGGVKRTEVVHLKEMEHIQMPAEEVSASRKFCSKCGAEIVGGISFCSQCGSKVK